MKLTKEKLYPRSRWILAIALSTSVGAIGFTQDSDEEEIFELSPFEVTRSDSDIGYRATNTLAGTRMNSRLKDIGASITVVTQQQMEDTASADLNDIFLYESNTEGAGNYTAYSVGGNPPTVRESIQQAPAEANRIRGIGSAERAINYFSSLSQIPVDTYNIERLTINRGPNSVLYGLGAAAGLVNTTPGRATIGGDLKQVQFRVGSDNLLRGSFNVNQTIVEDKLAVYVAAMYQEREWKRKPSHERVDRQYLALTYKPFEKTTIRGNVEFFSEDARRPNFTPPTDYVSHWIASGRPTYNPVTRTATGPNGETAVVTETRDTAPGSINNLAVRGLFFDFDQTRSAFLVDDGEFLGRYQRSIEEDTNPDFAPGRPLFSGTRNIDYMAGVGHPYETPGYELWTTPQLNNKELYDYESINILSGNTTASEATTYELSLGQELLENLYLDIGFFKQDWDQDSYQIMGERGVRVDPNTHLLDGSENPTALKTYIYSVEPTPRHSVANNEILRGNLAYELDFTDRDNVFRHLGRHQAMGLVQNRKSSEGFARNRAAVISDDHSWVDASQNLWSRSNDVRVLTTYYVVGENGYVEYDPGTYGLFGSMPVYGAPYPEGSIGAETAMANINYFVPVAEGEEFTHTYSGVNGIWEEDTYTVGTVLHSTVGSKREIDSQGAVLQSFFWDDKIVTTFGWRKDEAEDFTQEGTPTNAVGYPTFGNLGQYENPNLVEGETTTRGIVIHPFEWLSLHYNDSDNFNPASLAVDFFGNALPNPTGEGEDYGITFNLFENKLVAKINWYEASEVNSRNLPGDIGRFTWRSRRVEDEGSWGFRDYLEAKIEQRDGLDDRSLNEIGLIQGDQLNPAYTYADEIISKAMYPESYYNGPNNYSDTASVLSEGMEFEVIYNPIQNWNLKFTAGKQETIYSDLGFYTTQWLYGENGDYENPEEGSRVWLWRDSPEAQFTYTDAAGNAQTGNWFNDPATLWGSDNSQVPREWFEPVVKALLDQAILQDGLPLPQVRKWRWNLISNYRFIDGRFQGFGVGGAVRWQDKASIGSQGVDTDGDGNFDAYNPNQLFYDKAEYNLDLWASYSRRIMEDKVDMKIQLNVRDAFDNGGLRRIAANPDGSTMAYRIEDGTTYLLTTSFEF